MTGRDLYEKAKNNGRGFLAFDRLPGVQKGLWNNAALEVTHLEEKLEQLEEEIHNANDHIHDMEHM